MKTTFPIKEGTLEFFEDYIEIRDKWKQARFFSWALPISSIPYVLILALRREHDGEWKFGMVLLFFWIIFLAFKIINQKKRIYQSHLQFNQIEKVVLERFMHDRLTAKFILKNGNRRLVDLDFDRFWKADLELALEAKAIAVESI